jgi:5-(aminomethyl)-3-furanmethanol phosphate kinase
VNHSQVTVVKLGGSLFDWPELPERWAEFLASRVAANPEERIVIIAGGGPTVEFIRELDRIHGFGEARAHDLALHALDFTANLLASLLPGNLRIVDSLGAVGSAWNDRALPILAPRRFMTEIDRHGPDPLPEGWDVTSDSIAARVASNLGAKCLILLKSAALPPETTRLEAARLELVDPVFPRVSPEIARVEYLDLRGSPFHSRVIPP